MKKILQNPSAGAVIGAIAGLIAIMRMATAVTMAQTPPASMRLYVFDCGDLLEATNEELTADVRPSLPKRKPTPCFLVVHPKGTLLWENGLNNEADSIPGGAPNGDTVTNSLKSQLAEIGYTPAKITYMAMSHYHRDHAGNSNDYAGSIWLTQRDMWHAMFGPWPGVLKEPLPNVNEWNKLKDAKSIIIDNKDYDVFGDGSVMILNTPAATPGHQSLFVNLPNTGRVVISGDLYTHSANHELFQQLSGRKTSSGRVYPKADVDHFKEFHLAAPGGAAYLTTMARIENFLDKHKAQLWIQHDSGTYNSLKKSPAYYD